MGGTLPVRNFSGGPGALPQSVLRQAQEAIAHLPGTGISVLGMSHRSAWFRGVLDEAEDNLRSLLSIPQSHAVLFLQGGGSLQFSMIPMNFLRGRSHAEYIVTGYWSARAAGEAAYEGETRIVWDGKSGGYTRLPKAQELRLSADSAYLHYVANETVEGLEFSDIPGREDVPLVCDMSSNLLTGPCDIARYACIYAHAQKNLGPAGVTVVIVRKDFAEGGTPGLPAFFDYRVHMRARSLYNTPPVFAIYILLLVTRWLRDDIGGLGAMEQINRQKAQMVYEALEDFPSFYKIHAQEPYRSRCNIAFRLTDNVPVAHFLDEAERQGFFGLAGHRSIGGARISLYDAVSLEDAEAVAAWLRDFAQANCK